MAANDLCSKLEAALAAPVTALALTGTRGTEAVSVTVNTGLDDDGATLPRVTCQADDTTEEVIRDSAIFRISCKVHIHSHSGYETLAVHRDRVAQVSDALMTDDRAAVLSAAVDEFHCYELRMLGQSAGPDQDSFHTTIEFAAVVCAANIT